MNTYKTKDEPINSNDVVLPDHAVDGIHTLVDDLALSSGHKLKHYVVTEVPQMRRQSSSSYPL